MLSDDMGWSDLSCYGGETPTPHIDGLAREGVRFTEFYSSAPECSPTRTALMTGRYPQRAGGLECAIGTGNVGRYDDAIRLREQHQLGLPPAENTLVRGLKSVGYSCVVSGKWHLGYEAAFLPLKHGFDRAFGPNAGGVDYFFHTEWDGVPRLLEEDRPVTREGYMTDLITDYAVRAIEEARDGALFLYVPFTAPHTPVQGPADRTPQPILKATWDEGTPEQYAAMLRSLDDAVGRILAALDARGWSEEALVIFMSDNGATPLGGSGPWRGSKSTLYEGGIHVPCVARWPGHLPAGAVSAQVALTMDFTRSILRVAGAEPERELDGIDILQRVEQGAEPESRTVFWRYRRGETTWRAVRDGDWKMVQLQDGDQFTTEVFDLKTDPSEEHDVKEMDPGITRRLGQRLDVWQREVKAAR
ncbi:MAG: sulfatase-like hydrolase/transferase [Verrucomicrobiales bacterium]|nr:sulfatase-like hydrolase/transferase [Verrucomicrobiales bacterium]